MKNLDYPQLRQAIDAVGGPQVQVQPNVWDTTHLTEMFHQHKTLMVMGKHENVVDPSIAEERARMCGIDTIHMYEKAGHMFFCEPPYDTQVITDIQTFLSN